MTSSSPILLYHHVAYEREITPYGFRSQLKYLLELGYQSISLDELLKNIKNPERKTFVVTFDDGYLDNWFYAFPVLQELKIKATIFLVTERMENHENPRVLPASGIFKPPEERGPGGFLSWSECRAMQASGLVTFGSHTHTHRHWKRRELYQNLEAELRDSKALIEKNLRQPCLDLAWPWGDYENSWMTLLGKSGYRSALTTLSGANSRGTPVFALRRLKVSREDPHWLASRCAWHKSASAANAFGLFYGWDRRFKTWIHSESPYAHG
jgi:peptidoglycan/xylan/chitin deacetylase (PgdA/CDA1 family)